MAKSVHKVANKVKDGHGVNEEQDDKDGKLQEVVPNKLRIRTEQHMKKNNEKYQNFNKNI